MELVVGISGINAADNPGPGAGIARSLKEEAGLAVRTVGLAYDALEPGIYMPWIFDSAYTLPFPSQGGDEYIARLLEIQADTGMNWLLPNLDVELPLVIRYRDELAAAGIQTFLPTLKQFRLRGKDKLTDVAGRIDAAVPQTIVVHGEDELYTACQQIGFPLWIKGIFYQAKRAETHLEATAHFRSLAAEWGYPILVQACVAGDELNLVGVGDGEGGLLGAVAMKKISTTSLGKVWAAVSVDNPRLCEIADRFVTETRWRGPFELECIYDPQQDEQYLIEINPRFPAWSYFATGLGVNLPARMLRSAMGGAPEPAAEYDAGRLFMRYTGEIVTDLDRFQSVLTQGVAS